jgi:hypothetical protein
MSHFAKISNGFVQQVIVAEQDFIDTLPDSQDWIQTSFNTFGNKHTLGGTPLRGNYGTTGYVYDAVNDVFYLPQPFKSWTLNQSTWLWEAPVAMPTDDKLYRWDEATTSWKETA